MAAYKVQWVAPPAWWVHSILQQARHVHVLGASGPAGPAGAPLPTAGLPLVVPLQPQLPAEGLLLDLPSLNTSFRQTISNRTTHLPRLTPEGLPCARPPLVRAHPRPLSEPHPRPQRRPLPRGQHRGSTRAPCSGTLPPTPHLHAVSRSPLLVARLTATRSLFPCLLATCQTSHTPHLVLPSLKALEQHVGAKAAFTGPGVSRAGCRQEAPGQDALTGRDDFRRDRGRQGLAFPEERHHSSTY